MTVKDLIMYLLDCPMDSKISLDLETYGPFSVSGEIAIREISKTGGQFGKYAIIRLAELKVEK